LSRRTPLNADRLHRRATSADIASPPTTTSRRQTGTLSMTSTVDSSCTHCCQ